MLNDIVPAVKDVGVGTRNTDFVMNSASYVSSGLEASVVASAGDVLLCCISNLWFSEAIAGHGTLYSVVGGSPVNNLNGAGGAVEAWYGYAGWIRAINVPMVCELVASDIDNGRCLVRQYVLGDTAATKTNSANAGAPAMLWVINLGPVHRGQGTPGRVIGWNRSFTNLGGDGSLDVNSTSYASTGMEVTIPGSPGDLVLIGGGWIWWVEAFIGVCDAVTRVGGADVSYISGNGSGGFGIYGWAGFAISNSVGGPQPYVLAAGDISGGNVTFRIVAKLTAAGTKQLVGSNARLWAINLGQAEL